MNDHQEWKQLISAYVDDELSAEDRDKVNDHLVECPACQKYLQELKTLSLRIKQTKINSLSPDLEDRLVNVTSRREQFMQKFDWQGAGKVFVVFFLVGAVFLTTQTYIKRGLQGRLRSAADDIGDQYSAGNTSIVKIITRGAAGRMKATIDGVGEQYDPMSTDLSKTVKRENIFDKLNYPQRAIQARIRDASQYMATQTSTLASTAQYEPYYQSSQYEADRVSTMSSTKEQVALQSFGQKKSDTGFARMDGTAQIARKEGAAKQTTAYSLAKAPSAPLAFEKGKKAGLDWKDTSSISRRADPGYGRQFENLQGVQDERTYNTLMRNEQEIRVRANGATGTSYNAAGFLGGIDENRAYYPAAVPMEYQPADREQYDLINENEFLEVTQDPLSTFSIDVDTASYSNLRRFLTNNQLPPRDSVRIEEMINYFDYDYPEPKGHEPFSITLEQGQCPWNTSHQLVLVGLQGKTLSDRKTPESNLVFLIDVSGSMNTPDKLPLLKESLKMMVSQLRPQEHVSMVVYAGAAGVVLDSTPGHNKGLIMEAIDRLQAGGSTAGGQGIRLAYEIARKNFIRGGNNRVILATDGDFNVGVSSDSELVQIIEQERKNDIFLTVLGFGTGNLQDGKMEKIADKGNGNYYYIDSLNEGKKVLVDELGSTIFTIAKDVKIQIEFNPNHIKAYRLIGYENRKLAKEDFNDDTKDAGEMGAGHTVTALYEIVPAGSWENTGGNVDPLKYQKQTAQKSIFTNENEMMTVKLRYKEPTGDNSRLITKVLNRPGYSFGKVWYGASDNLNFASAVAEFGMLLRDSKFKGNASYQNVLQRSQSGAYNDAWGYKSEFVSLVQKAASLDNRPVQPYPMPQPYCPTCYDHQEQPTGYNQKNQGL